MTILETVNEAEAKLASVGIEDARRDVELLLAQVLHLKRVDLHLERHRELTIQESVAFHEFLLRRAAREPIAYIVGSKGFWNHEIEVTRDVLIPRPETETVVEEALRLVEDRSRPWRVLDLCTGSGCIAAAIASEMPKALITVTDISVAALTIARRNLAFAADRITYCASDLFCGLDPQAPFDLIISNPPYIAERDRAILAPEILAYEPQTALFAGESGLDFIARIVEDAPQFLVPGGWLVLEIGHGQADAATSLAIGTERYDTVRHLPDLAQKERVLLLRRSRFN